MSRLLFQTPSWRQGIRSLAAYAHWLPWLLVSSSVFAVEYQVGPGKQFNDIGQVPWESLAAGDQVKIHWRTQPYHEKWVLCCRGTSGSPIIVSGVPGPKGQLPVIDGREATTRANLNYYGEERAVIKIGAANRPADRMPAHLVVENLEIRSGRRPYTFTGRKGAGAYSKDAAGIYVEKVDHLVLRNLVLQDNGNGLMISPQSSDVLVERCSLFDNGNQGSITEHNSYTEANGIVFQYNHYGPLRKNCLGNNLKDRSAGLIIRHNWIEGGNRQLDLVDATGNQAINNAPAYRKTLVYGNVLFEREGDGNNQVVHYGGDSGNTRGYRKGVLYFYHNTVVSTRLGSTSVFRLSTADESVDCRNNIFFVTARGKNLALMSTEGRMILGHNWLKDDWRQSLSDFVGMFEGADHGIQGEDPGFESVEKLDFHLKADSPCLGTGTELAPEVLPTHSISNRYKLHQQFEPVSTQPPLNLGAF